MPDTKVEAALARADERFAKLDRAIEGVRAYAPKVERAVSDASTRVVRAGAVLGIAGGAAGGYALAVAPIGVDALLIGGPVAAIAAVGAALLPTRHRATVIEPPKFAEIPPARLAPAAVEWLNHKRAIFPKTAAPATQRILERLTALGPVWAAMDANDPALIDARRLISDHLPRLVAAYEAVPAAARGDAPVEAGLSNGLATIADEINRLWSDATAGAVQGLSAESRFLEARYGGGT